MRNGWNEFREKHPLFPELKGKECSRQHLKLLEEYNRGALSYDAAKEKIKVSTRKSS